MLSADVPEFVPRAYQNLDSPSNTGTSESEARTLKPQQTSTSRAYKPPSSSRFGLSCAPMSSWREGRATDFGLSHSSAKQNDVWRQSRKDSGSWRGPTHEGSRLENRTETLPEACSAHHKMTVKQVPQKGRGRGKPMSSEDLESQIRSKFVTPSLNMTHSYTRILKNDLQNSKPEAKPRKQEFSLSTDSQWPALGKPQSQNMSSANSESVKKENITNPWVYRSNEVSPAKSPMKNPQNPWQESGEVTKNTAVSSKITEEHHKPLENAVKIKQGTLNLQKSIEIKSSMSDSRRLEGMNRHAHENLCVVEPQIQNNRARSALITEENSSSRIDQHEVTIKDAKNSAADEDSDSLKWKVMGEKKKKGKVKKEEVHASSRPQEPRSDGKKYARNFQDKPSPSVERKQSQEYSGKITKNVLFSMLNNERVHPSSLEACRESKKTPITLKSSLIEGRKSRPTKVASLANCSSDKKEVRSAKNNSAVLVTKPVDEETLQRRLAAKVLKQKAKKKKREMKAQQTLELNRPKDTRVSFITTDFLEKTQTCNEKASNQALSQEISRPHSTYDAMTFTSEEYPALQMWRNTTPGLPLNRFTQLKTTRRSEKGNKVMLSTQGQVQGQATVLRKTKAENQVLEKGAVALEGCATTYRTALLAAKGKESNLIPELNSTEVNERALTETVLQKKKVRTTDRIELDLFALAAHSGKKKKKELLIDEYSPTKRRLQDESENLVSKTGLAAHSLLNKGAVVVAKRGKISTKPKKKKMSRIKKHQMEKRQRDILALQLLLEQARLRTAQQNSLEGPPATHIETEEPSKELGLVQNKDTNEQHSSSFMTEEDHKNDDDRTRELTTSEMNERDSEDEDNKETKTSEISLTLNTDSQIKNEAANERYDNKTTITWEMNKTDNSMVHSGADRTNSEMRAENNGDKLSNQQITEESSVTSASSAHQLLMNDPQVVQRASELISFVKSQNSGKGTREYIHQVVTPEVNAVAKELMKSLIAFQARQYQREPVKARIRRRYVCGLKETTKLMGKMSCVIMAPNIEQCEGPGALDDAVEKLLNQAEKHKVPVVFALSMRAMRKLCHKSGKRVSCFGIINYQGAQDLFKHLMQLLPEAQKQYQQLVACGQCSLPKEEDKEDDDEEEEKKKKEEEGEKEKEEVEEKKKREGCKMGKQDMKRDLTEEIIAHTNALLLAP